MEEISTRQIQISWKTESTTSILEYHIELNGRPIGITKKHETAAVISNLTPGTLYDVRIFSFSPGRFQTPSTLFHLRTLKASSTSSEDTQTDANPIVRALAPRVSPAPTIVPSPAAAHEPSLGQTLGRRGTNAGRKGSPAGQGEATPDAMAVEDEPAEDLAELSQQFDRVTSETKQIEQQIQDEFREHNAVVKEKEAQLAVVKQENKERDEASNELKRQVHRAEATNRSLQSEKSKKEKQLKDRENRRRRRIDEMAKWEERAQSIAEEIDGITKQKDAIRRRTESETTEIREKIAEEHREIQQLEEENREKALQLKELQEERQRNSVDEETEESREADRQDQERDHRHRQTLMQLSQQYNAMFQEMQRLHQESLLARQRLAVFTEARRSTAVTFAPISTVDMNTLRGEQRRNRHASSHGSNVSSPRAMFAPEPFSSVNQAVTTPTPVTMANRFNSVNGMVMDIPLPLDDEDEDFGLSAPMSPRADALLPHDLLGDDDDDADDDMDPDDDPVKPSATDPSLSPFPTLPAPQHGVESHSPPISSPGSGSSPRSFTSPPEETLKEADPDRRSIRSSHVPIPEDAAPTESPTHKRLTSMSNLFSFNRQRGKTSADQLPILGSLSKTESHSFPRKAADFDPALQPRRRLSYGGNNWTFSGGNFLGKGEDREREEPSKPSLVRRGFPSLLPGLGKSSATRSYDPFAPTRSGSFDPGTVRDGSSSPRPGSIYSFDKLPRPSAEDSFRAWAFERPGARNSPLVPDWASSISRNHSRRPSLGYGSTTNLSLNTGNQLDDGEFLEPRRDNRPLQAPIGTRPTSSQLSQPPRPTTPKLNPNAPSFTMLSLFGKDKDKTKSKDKDKSRSKEKDESLSYSPPESRKSRDAHSIANTTSTLDSTAFSQSRDSLERTTSGHSAVASAIGSLDSTPATATKPTFMSKITRKASSSKFDSWKHKSTGLFSSRASKAGEATTPTGDITEDENNESYEHLGRSLESSLSTPAGGATPSGEEKDKKGSRTSLGSWNFMRKRPKVGREGTATTLVGREDLTASEISENTELISESGRTSTTDGDRFSYISEDGR